MKKYLVITIDVEPDCTATWHYATPLSFRGVSTGIAERLQPLFNKYSIVPTYLINNVVLEENASTEVLGNLTGKYELGTHLHPEFIEPEKSFDEYAGKKGTANCCYYPPPVEFEKIKNITLLFEKKFGYRPTAFRAGRYSAGANTIKSLSELGYLVDTSITPHICWDDKSREKPVDFTHAPEQPYFMQADNITMEGTTGKLLQVPISIALKKRNIIKEFIVSAGGLRHTFRKYKAVWLRPYYSGIDTMTFIVEQFSIIYQNRECIVYNMMFHNVEVLPGLSPYTHTEDDCKIYLNQLEQFFVYCRQKEIESIGISELYHVFKKK